MKSYFTVSQILRESSLKIQKISFYQIIIFMNDSKLIVMDG